MFPEALDVLTCPQQPAQRLELAATATHQDAACEIITGTLRPRLLPAQTHLDPSPCMFPVRNGIPDMLGFQVPPSPAQFTNYLPPTAWAYERLWRPRALSLLTGQPFGYERELPLIMGMLAPERGGLYVDMACSNGLYARAVARALPADDRANQSIGIDHALPMLHQARRYAQQQQLRISYVRASAQAMPFADGSVAGMVMGGSLNEIGDRAAFLRETRRVLAPDGRFVQMHLTRAERGPGRRIQPLLRPGGIDFVPLEHSNQELASHGLELAEQQQYGIVVFSQWRVAPA